MTDLRDINFLIIGAAKSATTWLQQSLMGDPEVSMPDPEIHYFSREYRRGDDWYRAQFPTIQGRRLVGEKSNSYLDCPEAAARIRKVLPHARLVAQLRNPIERAYSDYCMLYRRGEVGIDIDRYLDPRKTDGNRFLSGGLYYSHLEQYISRFPVEQLLVLLYEDMKSAPGAQIARVRSHLGLAASTPPLFVKVKVKDKATPMIAPGLKRYLRPFKPLVAPLRQNQYFKALHAHFAREIAYPSLSADLQARLVDYYAADVERLSALLDRDLSNWLLDTPSAVSFNLTANSDNCAEGSVR